MSVYPRYIQKASRIEFCCVRCLYAIPLMIIGGIIAGLLGFVLGLFSLINFITVVLLGRRSETFYNIFEKLQVWSLKVSFYLAGATDERPPLTPL